MNMKMTANLKNYKFNSTNVLLTILSITCTIFFFIPQFKIIWNNGDNDVAAMQDGMSYFMGMIIRKGWGPNSEHKLGSSHPMALICLLIPVIILLLLLLKKTSDSVYKYMAIMVFVDFVSWQMIRTRAKTLAERFDLDYESTPCFVFNLIFLICMFLLIVFEFNKNNNLETYIKNVLINFLNKKDNDSKMMPRYCCECGNELKSNHVFCISCGKKIERNYWQ